MKKSIIGIISVFILSVLVPQCAQADVLYGNFARTIFTNAVTATNTTAFKVVTVTNFPTIAGSNYYYLVCLRASDNKKEIVKVTAATNGTLTVVRGQENTVPQTFAVNDRLELWITAGVLGDIQQEMFTYTDNEIIKQATVNTSNLANYVVTEIKLATNAVQTYSISNGVVTSDKILDYTIASVDIASNNVLTQHILDSNVTTAKIADDNVTFGKMQEIPSYSVLGNIGAVAANPAQVIVYDQDNMVSNSATALCSQQSIKAYVDTYADSTAMQYSGALVFTNSTIGTTGTDIDLSPWVGANSAFVHLKVYSTNTTARAVMFRTEGDGFVPSATNPNGTSTLILNTLTAGGGYVSLVTDANGAIDAISTVGNATFCYVYLVSYQILQ